MKTRQAVRVVKQSIFLDVYGKDFKYSHAAERRSKTNKMAEQQDFPVK
jgi:hypothetical protein